MHTEQYPDILIREGDLPSQGLPCRLIPERGGKVIRTKDGADVVASYTIAFPVDTPMLLIDEVIDGLDVSGEYIVYKETIKMFHRGQFHCKAYV